MTPEEAKRLLLGLALAKLRGGALSEEEQAFFERALQRYDYATMEAAIDAHIRSSPFWPQVADLVAQYEVLRRPRPELVGAKQRMLPPPGETLAPASAVIATMKDLQEKLTSAVAPAPRSRLGLWLDESDAPAAVRKELEEKKGLLPLSEPPAASTRKQRRKRK